MASHEGGRAKGSVEIITDVMPEPQPLAGAAGVPPRRTRTGIGGGMDFSGSEPPKDVVYGDGTIPRFVPEPPPVDLISPEVRQNRREASLAVLNRRRIPVGEPGLTSTPKPGK